MSILAPIRHLKNPDMTGFIPVYVAQTPVGWTRRNFAPHFCTANPHWQIKDDTLALSADLTDFDSRTQAIDKTFTALADKNLVPRMPDYSAFGSIDWFAIGPEGKPPLAAVKRFYRRWLGVPGQAVILHGYSGDHYWVAKRGPKVDDAPGMLDVITAGAIDYRRTIEETLIEESWTEAGVTAADLAKAQKFGMMTLSFISKDGFLDCEYFHIFDLDMGKDIVPQTQDPAEVAGFQFLPCAKVLELVEQGTVMKDQINMVIAEFLLRRGYITEKHPEFTALKKFLYEVKPLEECVR